MQSINLLTQTNSINKNKNIYLNNVQQTNNYDIKSNKSLSSDSTFLELLYPFEGMLHRICSGGPACNPDGSPSKLRVSWKRSEDIKKIKIEFSKDNGLTWSIIGSDIDATLSGYEFETSVKFISNNCKIRLTDIDNTENVVENEGNFSIVSLEWVDMSTSENNVIKGGTSQTISWKQAGLDSLKIEYSTNSDRRKRYLITESAPADVPYIWNVPNLDADDVFIILSHPVKSGVYVSSQFTDYYKILRYLNVSLSADSVIIQKPSYINLLFHALDENGLGEVGLQNDDLIVMENNQLISPSESFMQFGKSEQLDFTMRTVLTLDNSFSLSQNDLDVIKEAAKDFVRKKDTNQQIAIYTFSENVNLLRDFTTDTTLLIQAINGVNRGFPSTNLYGSIITSLSKWEDSYSLSSIEHGTLVVFTDGDDTQASSTLQQVLDARGAKRIITIGLGNDLNTEVLQTIGNGGYFRAANASELNVIFNEIQENLIQFTKSFYWLNYISPKRGPNTHELKVSINGNENSSLNSSMQVEFNSDGFYSVYFGIVINPDPLNPIGIDSLEIKANIPTELKIQIPFSFNSPNIIASTNNGESFTFF